MSLAPDPEIPDAIPHHDPDDDDPHTGMAPEPELPPEPEMAQEPELYDGGDDEVMSDPVSEPDLDL
jgi:hypothetical protein